MSWCTFFCCCCCGCCCSSPIRFTYEEIRNSARKSRVLRNGLYVARATSEGFLSLQRMRDGTDDSNYTEILGWKLHIAVHYEDIQKAWNLVIKDIIMRYNIRYIKFMQQEDAEREFGIREKSLKGGGTIEVSGAGREFTFYACKEPESRTDLSAFVDEMETSLRAANIRTVECCPACDLLPNSRYISYRCDAAPTAAAASAGRRSMQACGQEYIAFQEAIALARRTGGDCRPSNPHGYPMPPFLQTLIASRQEQLPSPMGLPPPLSPTPLVEVIEVAAPSATPSVTTS